MAIVAVLFGGAAGMMSFIISLFVLGMPLGQAAQMYAIMSVGSILLLIAHRTVRRHVAVPRGNVQVDFSVPAKTRR
ncbi:MAG: hypothetical protein AAF636_10060 [Pseudomonadota bacterium]